MNDQLVTALAAAITSEEPWPPFEVDLTLESAYQLQRQVVAEVAREGVAGVKAGVTGAAAQKMFGVEHALLGQLYSHGELTPGAQLEALPKLAIECEMGLWLGPDEQAVSVAPALEFVRSDFSRKEDARAPNLLVSNLAAYRFMPAAAQPLLDSYAGMTLRLTRNGELVNEAPVAESLGGPHAALVWIRKEAARRGIVLEEGMFVMTGACGQVVPGLPGDYVADYGVLGSIAFSIVAA